MANPYHKDERPKCDEDNCFAYDFGRCTLLTDQVYHCGFYKTKEEVNSGVIKAYRRLSDLGYNVHKSFPVLYEQYRRAMKK